LTGRNKKAGGEEPKRRKGSLQAKKEKFKHT